MGASAEQFWEEKLVPLSDNLALSELPSDKDQKISETKIFSSQAIQNRYR